MDFWDGLRLELVPQLPRLEVEWEASHMEGVEGELRGQPTMASARAATPTWRQQSWGQRQAAAMSRVVVAALVAMVPVAVRVIAPRVARGLRLPRAVPAGAA